MVAFREGVRDVGRGGKERVGGVWIRSLEREAGACPASEPTRLLRLLLFSGNRGGNPGSLLSVRFVEFPPVISESS